MAAGVSLTVSELTLSSVHAVFNDVLPTKDIFLEEARKFLALKLLSSWKTLKNQSCFVPDPVSLKSLAQLVRCRQDKLEDLADEAILPLFDALSDLFAECVKIVESDFCNDEFGLLEVKIENQIELAFDGETRANSSDTAAPAENTHLCEFCSARFDDAESLYQHIDFVCSLTPFPVVPNIVLNAAEPIIDNVEDDDDDRGGESGSGRTEKELTIIEQECKSKQSLSNGGPATRGRNRRTIMGKKKISKKNSGVGTKGIVGGGRGARIDGRRVKRTLNSKNASIGVKKIVSKNMQPAANPESSDIQEVSRLKVEGEDVQSLSCRICGEMFPDKAKLHKHIWKHNRKRNHICDICGKGFWMKYLLYEHRNTHTGERPYVCLTCGDSFRQLQGYNAHKRAHRFERKIKDKGSRKRSSKKSGEEGNEGGGEESTKEPKTEEDPSTQNGQPLSLNCQYCGRGCKTLRTLTNHESIHTSGISKNSYKYFMEVKEKEFEGEKEHACEVCDEKFAFKNSLSYHRRKCHRMFICGQCGKSYNCAQALNNHLRAHTGEKNFECPECHKKYLHQAGLIKHMEVHEGKTFSCEICKRTFTRAAYLKKHQVMHGDQDKYAEVKSKRAANCRRQRSGMSDDQKEEYKKERRTYMRDWLSKKRQTTAPRPLLEPVISSAIFSSASDSLASTATTPLLNMLAETLTTVMTTSTKLSATTESATANGYEAWAAPNNPYIASNDGATTVDSYVTITEGSPTHISNPTIFTPATTTIPLASSAQTIMPISSLMKTISTSGLSSSSAGQETIFIDPATMATIVGGRGQQDSIGELKPLTFTLPSNLVEGPSLSTNDLKPLTLTLPSNFIASLGLATGLQTTNQLQFPAHVLPIALANGTVTNVPISMANALFSSSTISTSLPPL